jgi:hypothetical protein
VDLGRDPYPLETNRAGFFVRRRRTARLHQARSDPPSQKEPWPSSSSTATSRLDGPRPPRVVPPAPGGDPGPPAATRLTVPCGVLLSRRAPALSTDGPAACQRRERCTSPAAAPVRSTVPSRKRVPSAQRASTSPPPNRSAYSGSTAPACQQLGVGALLDHAAASMATMRSASRTVDSRWAMAIVVRWVVARLRASWTSRFDHGVRGRSWPRPARAPGVLQQHPRDGQPLLLPAGEPGSPVRPTWCRSRPRSS